jgi:hypothetical protein
MTIRNEFLNYLRLNGYTVTTAKNYLFFNGVSCQFDTVFNRVKFFAPHLTRINIELQYTTPESLLTRFLAMVKPFSLEYRYNSLLNQSFPKTKQNDSIKKRVPKSYPYQKILETYRERESLKHSIETV